VPPLSKTPTLGFYVGELVKFFEDIRFLLKRGFVMVLEPELFGLGAAAGVRPRILRVELGLFDIRVISF
jgi:hypothetical protein